MRRIKRDQFLSGEMHSGFTLVELIVAIGIFIVVALIVTGMIVSLMRLNRSNRQSRLLLTSMNTVMDAITLPARERAPGTVFFCRSGSEDKIGEAIYYPKWRYSGDIAREREVSISGIVTDSNNELLCIKCPIAGACSGTNQVPSLYGSSISFLSQVKVEDELVYEELSFYRSDRIPGKGAIYMSKCHLDKSDKDDADPPSTSRCTVFKQQVTPDDVNVTQFNIVPFTSPVSDAYAPTYGGINQQGVQIIIEAKTMSSPAKTIHLQTAIAARQL